MHFFQTQYSDNSLVTNEAYLFNNNKKQINYQILNKIQTIVD